MSKGDGMKRVIAALWSRSNPRQEVRSKYLGVEPEHISFMIEVEGETMEAEAYQGVKGAIVCSLSDKATISDLLAYLGLSQAELLDNFDPQAEEIARLQEGLRGSQELIGELLGLLRSAKRYIGDVDCGGYKCRLPQCGDCNYERDNGYVELLKTIDALWEKWR